MLENNLQAEKRWAMLCYVPVINVVVCLLASVKMVNSSLVLFHLRQGLILIGVDILAILVGFFSKTLSLMFWGVVLLVHIAGLVTAYKLVQTPMPVITNLAMRIPPFYLYKRLTGKDPEPEQPKQPII